jgi:hypothetical protein
MLLLSKKNAPYRERKIINIVISINMFIVMLRNNIQGQISRTYREMGLENEIRRGGVVYVIDKQLFFLAVLKYGIEYIVIKDNEVVHLECL